MVKNKKVSERKAPKQERSQFLVDNILTAAIRVFQNSDYLRATTTRIADLAGVSIGSLYQYFSDKDSLLSSLIDRHISRQIDEISKRLKTLEGLPFEQAFSEIVKLIIEPGFKNRKLIKLLYERGPILGMTPVVVGARKKAASIIAEFLESQYGKHLKVPDLKFASFVIVNGVLGVISASMVAEADEIDEVVLVTELSCFVRNYLFEGTTRQDASTVSANITL